MLTQEERLKKTSAQLSAYAKACLQIQSALDTLSSDDCPSALVEALIMCKHEAQPIAQRTDSLIWARNRG